MERERRRITVGEVVRIAMSLSTADPDALGAHSVLLERVIDPAVRRAGETFLRNLDSITIEQMCEAAEKSHVLDDEMVSGGWRGRGGRSRQDNADSTGKSHAGVSPSTGSEAQS